MPTDRKPTDRKATDRTPLHVGGTGAVSCFGAGAATLLDAVFAGRSGVRPLERLAGTDCLTDVAAEVPAEICARVENPLHLARVFAREAAREALAGSDWAPDPDSILVVATTKADMSGVLDSEGTGRGSGHRLALDLAKDLGFTTTPTAISTACASGLSALAFASRALRARRATRALVVGTDCLTPFVLRGFSALLALAPGQCQPFDRDRRGLNLGEGAGALVLTTHPDEARGPQLLGCGESNDANHITGPSRDGAGLALAIQRGLADARISAASISTIHLHGTGTPYNDAMECRAITSTFQTPPPAAGSKAQIGHTLGAAGILESLITIESLRRRQTPGNFALTNPDPDHKLRLPRATEPLDPADDPADLALKVAAGFGGINAAIVFGVSP